MNSLKLKPSSNLNILWERGLTANSGMERNSSEGMKPQLLRSSWQNRWYRETISCCVTNQTDRRTKLVTKSEIEREREREYIEEEEEVSIEVHAFLQCCWTSSMSYCVSMEDVFPIVTNNRIQLCNEPLRHTEREREKKNEFAKLFLKPTSINTVILAQWAYIINQGCVFSNWK
jgi:hypothetical protein